SRKPLLCLRRIKRAFSLAGLPLSVPLLSSENRASLHFQKVKHLSQDHPYIKKNDSMESFFFAFYLGKKHNGGTFLAEGAAF
ncbi:MAG: hypothetical protein IKD18_05660, partial [Clostridia bacterium]|nr:hypothetical protein [Clostridia bacterium]